MSRRVIVTCSLCNTEIDEREVLLLEVRHGSRFLNLDDANDVCKTCLKTMFAAVGYSFGIDPQGKFLFCAIKK